ncbi:MAG: hydrolase [Pseudolysinimonas sp.]|uniref:amidohydrolase family protein n=1 Tax=Pseudolysinimonas sp. TaxID=2680009 RepID=UPI003267273F
MTRAFAILGAPTDAHVHLGLVDRDPVAHSVLGRVVDLGGSLSAPRLIHGDAGIPPLRVEFAGPFLTPVGGYPSDRDWADPSWVREIPDAAEAGRVVDELADAGVTLVKIASNAVAGPTFTAELLAAIVTRADARGLPTVVHVEGPGEAGRALEAGATYLAHAPFSELLSADEIAEHAARVTWISTLAIHPAASTERGVAVENVTAFRAAGGRLRYGTDMGNGPTPLGLNLDELDALRDAGLTTPELLEALDLADIHDPASRLMVVDGEGDDLDFASARLLTPILREELDVRSS